MRTEQEIKKRIEKAKERERSTYSLLEAAEYKEVIKHLEWVLDAYSEDETPESREGPCGACRWCWEHIYLTFDGLSVSVQGRAVTFNRGDELKVKTGLFVCRKLRSAHYSHVITKEHAACEEQD